MVITLTQFVVWLIIAALVGILAEFISGRRAPAGILGAIMVGLFAIFLIVARAQFRKDCVFTKWFRIPEGLRSARLLCVHFSSFWQSSLWQ